MLEQSLNIGVYQPGFELVQILNSIGVLYEEIDFAELNPESYAAIILDNSDFDNREQPAKIEKYLMDGGSVLEIGERPFIYKSAKIEHKKVNYLVNNSTKPIFNNISHLDIYDRCALSKTKNAVFSGLVDFSSNGKGYNAFIGLNFERLFRLQTYKRKRFISQHGTPPDEIVSRVSRGTVQQLVKNTLLALHIKRNLPLIAKWHSPTKKPVFTFRIDSDFGTQESMDHLYLLAKEYDFRLTWFLHVAAHEKWINHFKTYKNQELALHCYKHGTTTSANKLSKDFTKAKSLLSAAGLQTDGYAAPYGIWTKAHSRFFRSVNIKYSSDFSLGYNGLPYKLKLENNKTLLQIPIHPICTGSLNRRRYSFENMKLYFNNVIADCVTQNKPIMLYHHPLQPNKEIVEHIFKKVKETGYYNLTYSEYADFWANRERANIKAVLKDNNTIAISNNTDDIILEINRYYEQFSLTSGFNEVDLENTEILNRVPAIKASPSDVKVLYSNKFKLLKIAIFDWKNRIRL